MAWNDPGGGDKDPWTGRGKGPEQGPPDLDEVVKSLQQRFDNLFGKRGKGGGNNGGNPPSAGPAMSAPNPRFLGVVVGAIALIWMATGIYIVEPAERGVVLRFGAYAEQTGPGPHWHWPYPMESVIKVNVDEFSSFRHAAQMLTRDENIVDIELTVQSRIQDADDYLL